MNELSLNAKELICLAALMDVSQVFGIPDAFADRAESQMKAEVMTVQRSLEKKGVLKMDFDGNSDLNTIYADLLDIVLRCDHFIAVDRQAPERGQNGFLFYLKGKNSVSAVINGDDYLFTVLSPDDLVKEIHGLVFWNELSGAMVGEQGSMTQRVLTHLKRKGEKQSLKLLRETGLSETASRLVCDALSLKAQFYSFAFVDVHSRVNGVRSVMFLGDKRGIIRLETAVRDNVDYVTFTSTTPASVEQSLRTLAVWRPR